jgi:Formylmethanofuran dehydrogenase subunit E
MLSCVQLPVDPELYSDDVRPIVSQTIARFGAEEWKAAVLTNELHGHLGIYAIMGVKMGLAALEYFGVEAGEISIRSYAGVKPPVSCMNDGLQVSTEATFGHGLICSPPTDSPLPMADFTVRGRTIHVRFKQEIEQMIKQEIRQAFEQYAHTPPYWDCVRKLAIQYWAELDRKEVFTIVEVPLI